MSKTANNKSLNSDQKTTESKGWGGYFSSFFSSDEEVDYTIKLDDAKVNSEEAKNLSKSQKKRLRKANAEKRKSDKMWEESKNNLPSSEYNLEDSIGYSKKIYDAEFDKLWEEYKDTTELLSSGYEPQQYQNYAYSDEDINSINQARNNRDGYQHYVTRNPRTKTDEYSGILVKEDGTFLRDDAGNLIVEMPAVSSDGTLQIFLESQLLHLKRLEKQLGEEADIFPVKILFPYHKEGHWSAGEITAYKSGDDLIVDATAHDSLGGGQLSEDSQKQIQTAFKKMYPTTTVNFELDIASKAPQVQSDGSACGVYVGNALHKLKTGAGEDLWNIADKSEEVLREEDYNLIREYNKDQLVQFRKVADKSEEQEESFEWKPEFLSDEDKGVKEFVFVPDADKQFRANLLMGVLSGLGFVRGQIGVGQTPQIEAGQVGYSGGKFLRSANSPTSLTSLSNQVNFGNAVASNYASYSAALSVPFLRKSEFNLRGSYANSNRVSQSLEQGYRDLGEVVDDDDGVVVNTPSPTSAPSVAPTTAPSVSPTSVAPTVSPTDNPSVAPSVNPSVSPTSVAPTVVPTDSPTVVPTNSPTVVTTDSPTVVPTDSPTVNPTFLTTVAPTDSPTVNPTVAPTANPSITPTANPSITPTANPSITPTGSPTLSPTKTPTKAPTSAPTISPTIAPSLAPTKASNSVPSQTSSHSPTFVPTGNPTGNPSNAPSNVPSGEPSAFPIAFPTSNPPTKAPSVAPTGNPSSFPSQTPSHSPTFVPTGNPSNAPSNVPSGEPSAFPTAFPTSNPPTKAPSVAPTKTPNSVPSQTPSRFPTIAPSVIPTNTPTEQPTSAPSLSPTGSPTLSPTNSTIVSESKAPKEDIPLLAKDSYAGAGLTGVAALATVPAGEVGAFGAAGLASTLVSSSAVYAAAPLLGTAVGMYFGGQAVFDAVYDYNNPLTSNNRRYLEAIAELDNNNPIEGYNVLRRHLEEHGLIGNLQSIDLESEVHAPFANQIKALFEIGQGDRNAGFEAIGNILESVTTKTSEEEIQEYLPDQQPAVRAFVNLGEGNLVAGLMLFQQFVSENGGNIQEIDLSSDNFDPKFAEVLDALYNLGSQVSSSRPEGREIESGLEDITKAILNDMIKEREEEARREKENNKDEDEEGKDTKRERKRKEKQEGRRLNDGDKTDNATWAWIATAAFEAAASVVGTHSLRKKNRRTAKGASHVISAYMEEEVGKIIEYFEIADKMKIWASAIEKVLLEDSTLFNKNKEVFLSEVTKKIEPDSGDENLADLDKKILESLIKMLTEKDSVDQPQTKESISSDGNGSDTDKIIKDLITMITKTEEIDPNDDPNRYSTILHQFLPEERVKQVLDTPVLNDVVHTVEGGINIGRRAVSGLAEVISNGLGENNFAQRLAKQFSHEDEFSENFRKAANKKFNKGELARRILSGYDPHIVAGDIKAGIGLVNCKILNKALESINSDSGQSNQSCFGSSILKNKSELRLELEHLFAKNRDSDMNCLKALMETSSYEGKMIALVPLKAPKSSVRLGDADSYLLSPFTYPRKDASEDGDGFCYDQVFPYQYNEEFKRSNDEADTRRLEKHLKTKEKPESYKADFGISPDQVVDYDIVYDDNLNSDKKTIREYEKKFLEKPLNAKEQKLVDDDLYLYRIYDRYNEPFTGTNPNNKVKRTGTEKPEKEVPRTASSAASEEGRPAFNKSAVPKNPKKKPEEVPNSVVSPGSKEGGLEKASKITTDTTTIGHAKP